jgi:DNA-binding transcriptional MerR regulator
LDKSPDAFLTIGEMAERLGVRTHILRYWEEQFPMLRPLTRAGGRRLYRPSDVALLVQIHDLLSNQGYTIRGARSFLAKGGASEFAPLSAPEPAAPLLAQPTTAPNPAQGPQMAFVRDELTRIRERLSAALAAS